MVVSRSNTWVRWDRDRNGHKAAPPCRGWQEVVGGGGHNRRQLTCALQNYHWYGLRAISSSASHMHVLWGAASHDMRRALLIGTRRAFCTKGFVAPTGIFVDAENLTDFLQKGGSQQLISWAAEVGNPIVRKAYGNWNAMQGVVQTHLVENGFQLIHTPYPLSGKSAADIAMVVDVMGVLYQRTELQTFILATGDSDFSHLFCHLRQSGRTVIGVGPDSPLSRIVKNSCDKYILIDRPGAAVPSPSDWEEARRLVARTLESVDKDGKMLIGVLKERMLRLDSSFDEERLGCAAFKQFLSSDAVADLLPPIVNDQHGNPCLDFSDDSAAAARPYEVLGNWEEARKLVGRTLESVDKDGKMLIGVLKERMLRLDSSFDEERLGCAAFKQFLSSDAVADLLPPIVNDQHGNPCLDFSDDSAAAARPYEVLGNWEEARKLVGRALADMPKGGKLAISKLKLKMVDLDDSFDERSWGCKTFKQFLSSEALADLLPPIGRSESGHPFLDFSGVDDDWYTFKQKQISNRAFQYFAHNLGLFKLQTPASPAASPRASAEYEPALYRYVPELAQQLLEADDELLSEALDAAILASARYFDLPYELALECVRPYLQSKRGRTDWQALLDNPESPLVAHILDASPSKPQTNVLNVSARADQLEVSWTRNFHMYHRPPKLRSLVRGLEAALQADTSTVRSRAAWMRMLLPAMAGSLCEQTQEDGLEQHDAGSHALPPSPSSEPAPSRGE